LEEKVMKLKIVTAALMVAAFSLPAFAADEFYVVQDVRTKKCTIVDKKPTDTSMTVVSPSGTIYKSRTEAESGMKTVKVCTSN
jgi:cell division protein FtsL